jgi:hypothetical protein
MTIGMLPILDVACKRLAPSYIFCYMYCCCVIGLAPCLTNYLIGALYKRSGFCNLGCLISHSLLTFKLQRILSHLSLLQNTRRRSLLCYNLTIIFCIITHSGQTFFVRQF